MRNQLFLHTTALLCLLVLATACGRADQAPVTATADGDPIAQRREAMVQAYMAAGEIKSPLVLEAMRMVPREEFVLRGDRDRAYREMALRIRHGQTISQPFIVAEMTDLLSLRPGDRVLEIGTGSGYQAAVLAEITDEVYSIEIIRGWPRRRRRGWTPWDMTRSGGSGPTAISDGRSMRRSTLSS